MLGIRWAVHERNAQRHPAENQREVITGSFSDSQGLLDLAHRAIVGHQHATWYSRNVDKADSRSVGQGVGALCHSQAVPLVVPPSGNTQPDTGISLDFACGWAWFPVRLRIMDVVEIF